MAILYYLILTITTLSIGIFDISVSGESKDLQCYSLTVINSNTYDSQLDQINQIRSKYTVKPPNITVSISEGTTFYSIPYESSNSYKIFSDLIGAIYLVIMTFSLLMIFILFWLSDLIPEDFLSMGKVKKGFAVVSKICPTMIVVLHWVVFLLVIIFWIVLSAETCRVSQLKSGSVFQFNILKYHDLCVNLQIVNSIVVLILHFVFPIFKDMIYVEPFMYSPKVENTSGFKDVMIRVLGP